MAQQHSYDVLVVGSGAAGLSAALRLGTDLRVGLLSKGSPRGGSTLWAQGGISAVLEPDDSVEAHVHDTLDAGAGLCDESVVRMVVSRAPQVIDWLQGLGMPFTRDETGASQSGYHLTREGGHTRRRVVHSKDATGLALEDTLLAAARRLPGIEFLDHHIAIDLITAAKLGHSPNRCLGLYALDRDSGNVEAFSARCVILATGGANKAYLYTSNPDTSTGDGIAMAWRAGCRVADMEFIQFHPTCLYHPEAKSLLISEAVRGEGGRLLLPDGSSFMERFDPRAELAPRDIVARAIDHEMKRLGADCVYLDISHRGAEFVRSHFPTILERCHDYGIDITRQPIPVVPAAHYTCGGVATDRSGRADLIGLYAIGETAHTGMHGANRMASNSLLECLVFAQNASADILDTIEDLPSAPVPPPWDESRVTDSDEEVVVSHNWEELRRFMWDYVGIVRTDKRLQRAKRRVELLQLEIDEYYSNFRVTNDLIELRNLVMVAELIIRCAQLRHESRGLHYTLDYPRAGTDSPPQDTILVPLAPADDQVPSSRAR
jgi:L-aspartate oxidase